MAKDKAAARRKAKRNAPKPKAASAQPKKRQKASDEAAPWFVDAHRVPATDNAADDGGDAFGRLDKLDAKREQKRKKAATLLQRRRDALAEFDKKIERGKSVPIKGKLHMQTFTHEEALKLEGFAATASTTVRIDEFHDRVTVEEILTPTLDKRQIRKKWKVWMRIVAIFDEERLAAAIFVVPHANFLAGETVWEIAALGTHTLDEARGLASWLTSKFCRVVSACGAAAVYAARCPKSDSYWKKYRKRNTRMFDDLTDPLEIEKAKGTFEWGGVADTNTTMMSCTVNGKEAKRVTATEVNALKYLKAERKKRATRSNAAEVEHCALSWGKS